MVFCNSDDMVLGLNEESHNPYFNRWFSAMWFVLH